MAIATCSKCRISFNAATCPKCGRSASFDERLDTDFKAREEKRAADVKAQEDRHAQEGNREESRAIAHTEDRRIERARPLSTREIDAIKANVVWSLGFCREAEGAEELKATLARAKELIREMEAKRKNTA